MIEVALKPFLKNTVFKIVTKTVTDKSYGETDPTYTEVIVPAVVIPHSSANSLSLQEPRIDVGIDSFGQLDIYVKDYVFKKDDIVTYDGIEYKIQDKSYWNTNLGGFRYYIASV